MNKYKAYRNRKTASREALSRLCERQRIKLIENQNFINSLEFELDKTSSYRSLINTLKEENDRLEKQTPENWYKMELELSEARRELSKCRERYKELAKIGNWHNEY